MRVYNNDFEIINSGVVVSPNLNDTRFVVSEVPHMEIVFRVILDGVENGIRSEVIGDNTLAIIFTSPSGDAVGPAAPIRVGKLNGKPLYVMFRVTIRSDNASYGLDYTFYTKESE